MSPSDDDFKLSPELELEQIISLQKAEKVSSLSGELVEEAPRRQDHRDEPAPAWRAAAARADAPPNRRWAQGSSQRLKRKAPGSWPPPGLRLLAVRRTSPAKRGVSQWIS